jgi:hypothetical protein
VLLPTFQSRLPQGITKAGAIAAFNGAIGDEFRVARIAV